MIYAFRPCITPGHSNANAMDKATLNLVIIDFGNDARILNLVEPTRVGELHQDLLTRKYIIRYCCTLNHNSRSEKTLHYVENHMLH